MSSFSTQTLQRERRKCLDLGKALTIDLFTRGVSPYLCVVEQNGRRYSHKKTSAGGYKAPKFAINRLKAETPVVALSAAAKRLIFEHQTGAVKTGFDSMRDSLSGQGDWFSFFSSARMKP